MSGGLSYSLRQPTSVTNVLTRAGSKHSLVDQRLQASENIEAMRAHYSRYINDRKPSSLQKYGPQISSGPIGQVGVMRGKQAPKKAKSNVNAYSTHLLNQMRRHESKIIKEMTRPQSNRSLLGSKGPVVREKSPMDKGKARKSGC